MSNDAILDQAELSLNNGDAAAAERVLTQQWPDPSRAPGGDDVTLARVTIVSC